MVQKIKTSVEQLNQVCKNLPKLLNPKEKEKIHKIGREIYKDYVKDMETIVLKYYPMN